jgi:hypothetical protein
MTSMTTKTIRRIAAMTFALLALNACDMNRNGSMREERTDRDEMERRGSPVDEDERDRSGREQGDVRDGQLEPNAR